jgi:hypothetical protein
MRNIFLVAFITIGLAANAQYKKAGFLNKEGRTYEIGVAGHFMAKPRSMAPGIFLNYGKENENNLFGWMDFEFILPSKFSATTKTNPVTIVGKTKLAFAYRYNYGYYLVNKNKDENKILPYITGGLGFKLGGGGVTTTQDYSNTSFVTPDFPVVLGLNAGAGAVFRITKTLGVRFAGGYAFQIDTDKLGDNQDSGGYPDGYYSSYVSHPYATLSLRLTLNDD